MAKWHKGVLIRDDTQYIPVRNDTVESGTVPQAAIESVAFLEAVVSTTSVPIVSHTSSDLQKLKKSEVETIAVGIGVEVSPEMSKKELIDAILKAQNA
jgi:hypothetical protein